eukprot:4954058-Lingulodinium_polyedra.AAC.1
MLVRIFGSGLAAFIPEMDAATILQGRSRRETLVLHQDAGLAAYAFGFRASDRRSWVRLARDQSVNCTRPIKAL